MLVLMRKTGQSLTLRVPGLPDTIVTVVETKPGRVTIGIEAPLAIQVVRSELLSDAPAAAPLPQPSGSDHA